MYIVHLYPPNDPEIAQYVSLLTRLTDEHIETADNPDTFQQLCADRRPDIVHLHGCRFPQLLKAADAMRQQGVRIIVCPHGQMESWEMDHRKLRSTGLRSVVGHAYCLVARSEIEAAELRKTELNPRIEVLRNPILTRTTSPSEFQNHYLRIYRQVMDSHPLELLDAPTLHALRILLKVGITEDDRWGEPIAVEHVDWHHLLIYAQLEGILPFIEKGCLHAGIPLPAAPIPDSYVPASYVRPVSLLGKPLSDLVKIICQQVCTYSLPLLSLAELDWALRREDIEDDIVMQQLTADKMNHFFAALMTVLHEQTGLDEGFMPCEPVDNKETNRIRTAIQKHLQI